VLCRLVAERNHRKNLCLFLTTPGGSPDCAYRVVRQLQRVYKAKQGGRITVIVDSWCKSAGTLMTLGADDLVMSRNAELGPLDIQTQEREEIGEWSSGLKSREALHAIRGEAMTIYEDCFNALRLRNQHRFPTKLASAVATEMAIGMSRPLYEQIDPMRLAETARAMRIMQEYGNRIKTDNVRDRTVEELIATYPDHGFVIDRDEAQELFVSVRPPSEEESELCKRLPSSGLHTERRAVIRYLSQEVRVQGEGGTGDSRTRDKEAVVSPGGAIGPNGQENGFSGSNGRIGPESGGSSENSVADEEIRVEPKGKQRPTSV
jgi:hypothetical protein